MEAPDKIYLLKVELEERWPGITEASELEPKKEVCYIRKDAILEWAKEGKEHYKKLMKDFPDMFAGSFGAYNAFIEKLNSLESPAGMYKTE